MCSSCTALTAEVSHLREVLERMSSRLGVVAASNLSESATACLAMVEARAHDRQLNALRECDYQAMCARAVDAEKAADAMQLRLTEAAKTESSLRLTISVLEETIDALQDKHNDTMDSCQHSRQMKCSQWTQTADDIVSSCAPGSVDAGSLPGVSHSRSLSPRSEAQSYASAAHQVVWSQRAATRSPSPSLARSQSMSKSPSASRRCTAGYELTPIHPYELGQRPRLLDGAITDDVTWPAAEDSVVLEASARAVSVDSVIIARCRPKSPSLPSGSQGKSALYQTPRVTRAATPPSTHRSHLRDAGVRYSTGSRLEPPVPPVCVKPVGRRSALPQEMACMYRTAVEGLHMLRGLTIRADHKMFLTMSSVNELRDCGCPLKTALVKVKQTLLLSMPSLASKIVDGERWRLTKKDLLLLPVDHAGSIAKSLRELVVAHDYLRNQQRGETLTSVAELYLNIHIFVTLARSPVVQSCISF